MKIALIHNAKPPRAAAGVPEDYYSECDSPKTVRAIAKALESSGHAVLPVEANRHLPSWLRKNPVDLVFNIAEGFHGEAREARVPALLEMLEIPYTGSGVLALALALDKARSKNLFRSAGVPTPHFQLFSRADEPLEPRLHFPLIVKPNREGSAKGIWASSVVHQEAGLRIQIQKVLERYGQEVLVEEFIDGTELTVGILGDGQVLPILEIDFSPCGPSGETFYSWRMKEFQGNKDLHLDPRFWCPARLPASAAEGVGAVALKAARAVGYRDICRVDIRLSSDGIPFVLEVNPLPGLDPEESNFPMISRAAGISHEALLSYLVSRAMERSRKGAGGFTAPPLTLKRGALSSIPSSEKKDSSPRAPKASGLPAAGAGEGTEGPGVPAVARRRSPARESKGGRP